MLRFIFLIGVVVCVPALADDTAREHSKAPYLIGRATVDITPEYPVRLNGFGFRRIESEGVRQRIYAKALAISRDEGKPLLLVTADTLCIPDSLAERVAARLKEKAGVTRDRIAFTATHTHTAPMIRDVAPTIFGMPIPDEHQRHIDRYSREFEEAIEKVALAALADHAPARLFYGIGNVGFAANRRSKGGPVDHDLPVLVAKTPDGKVLAIWTTYACHCVTLSDNKISGDWAGYAQALIQREHPGATALVSIGCGADANPSSGVTGDKGDRAEAHGLEIAQEVNRLLANNLTPLDGEIGAVLQRIESATGRPAKSRGMGTTGERRIANRLSRSRKPRATRPRREALDQNQLPDPDLDVRRSIGDGVFAGRSRGRLLEPVEARARRKTPVDQRICKCLPRLYPFGAGAQGGWLRGGRGDGVLRHTGAVRGGSGTEDC